MDTLNKYGFYEGNYEKIIVTWDITDEAQEKANRLGIKIWLFKDIIHEIAKHIKDQRTHFTDDTLRTLQLYTKAEKELK